MLVFLHKRRYTSPLFQKTLVLPLTNFFSKYPLFTTFSLFLTYVKCVMLQINTEFLTNQLQKYFYTRDLTTLFHLTKKCSITEVSKKFLIVFTVG